jgi:hypothetical protein
MRSIAIMQKNVTFAARKQRSPRRAADLKIYEAIIDDVHIEYNSLLSDKKPGF